jgi:proteasome accessory factor C
MTYRQIITEVVALLEELAQPLTIAELATALGLAEDDIRRQVVAYDEELPVDLIGHAPHLWIEPAEFGEWPEVGVEEQPHRPSPQDLVRIEGARYGREVLGVERFGAAVLAPLYEAANDLAAREPGNEVLAGAIQTLLVRFLPGMRPSSRFKADLIGTLARAIGEERRVRIEYSRAWEPGVYSRVIEPYALVRTPRGAEVDAGPVQPDGSIRTYLIGRIRSVDALEEFFERPADADLRVAEQRSMTRVTGVAPSDRVWAMRRFADRFSERDRVGDEVAFEADYLPPVQWRVALALLVAGPTVRVADPGYHEEAADLARRLWDQHCLDER